MVRQLTDKQEKFAQLVVDGATLSDAYRGAYSTENMADASVNAEASKVKAHPLVSLRIQELKDELAERMMWSKIDSMTVLKEIAKGSADTQDKDRIAAVKELNSMKGWKAKTVDHKSTDGTMSPTRSASEMNDDELAAIANGDN